MPRSTQALSSLAFILLLMLAACGDPAPAQNVSGSTPTLRPENTPTTAPAGPRGALDETFGDGGTLVLDLGSDSDIAYDVLVQPDNKIVAVGATYQFVESRNETRQKVALARFNPDGSLDNTFGDGGKVVAAMLDDDQDSSVGHAAALLPGGKLLVAGSAVDLDAFKTVFFLARFNPDGSLDSTFGDGGRVRTLVRDNDEYGDQDIAYSIAVQPDGKVVLAGSTGSLFNGDFAIVRYNANGTLDTTFATDGIATIDRDSDDVAADLAIQPDGKILITGDTEAADNNDLMLARLLADGTPDSTFGTAGVVTPEIEGGDDFATSLLLKPDGKIVVGGYASWQFPELCQPVACEEFGLALAQYNPDGTLDTAFGAAGKVHGRFNRSTYIQDMVLLPNGKIVVAGNIYTVNFALVTYNSDGTLDTAFGEEGILATNFKADINGGDRIEAAALQPDGRIVVAGVGAIDELGIESDFALARYLP